MRNGDSTIDHGLWPQLEFVSVLNPGTAHEATLNTVVTEVTISSQLGNSQSPPVLNYSVATSFGELDPLIWKVVRFLGFLR